MEFVTQLWVYNSNKFMLGLPCPDFVKSHIWLFLLMIKTTAIGFSVLYFTFPKTFYRHWEIEEAEPSALDLLD